MARPRPLHALSTDLLFHRVGISRRRAAHEPKRLESPEFRPFPLALRLSYRADCQVSSCPFRPQVSGTSNRQNGTITTVQGNLPHYNSHGFNHLRLSNRPLTLRGRGVEEKLLGAASFSVLTSALIGTLSFRQWAKRIARQGSCQNKSPDRVEPFVGCLRKAALFLGTIPHSMVIESSSHKSK